MCEFLNNSQIEVFLANWEVVFFLHFSHVIYSMHVPEGTCMIGHTGNPSQGAGRAILFTTMDI